MKSSQENLEIQGSARESTSNSKSVHALLFITNAQSEGEFDTSIVIKGTKKLRRGTSQHRNSYKLSEFDEDMFLFPITHNQFPLCDKRRLHKKISRGGSSYRRGRRLLHRGPHYTRSTHGTARGRTKQPQARVPACNTTRICIHSGRRDCPAMEDELPVRLRESQHRHSSKLSSHNATEQTSLHEESTSFAKLCFFRPHLTLR